MYGRGNSQIWYVDSETNFLYDFNISATMAWEQGWVQVEQSESAWPWICLKWATEGFCAAQWRQCNTWSRNLGPKSKKSWCVGFSFLCIKMWRLRWKDTRLCFGKINRMAAFLAIMAQHRLPRPLEVERHRCTCTRATQTADTRTDATSASNATGAIWWQWGCLCLRNRWCATRICDYTFSSSQRSVFHFCCICQGSQMR